MLLWLSSKPRNIYTQKNNSDLVLHPPATNHAHYVVDVAEEQMDEIFWDVVRQLVHSRSLYTGGKPNTTASTLKTRGHCSMHV